MHDHIVGPDPLAQVLQSGDLCVKLLLQMVLDTVCHSSVVACLVLEALVN